MTKSLCINQLVVSVSRGSRVMHLVSCQVSWTVLVSLEAQDSNGKTRTETVMVKIKTITLTTKTVKILTRDCLKIRQCLETSITGLDYRKHSQKHSCLYKNQPQNIRTNNPDTSYPTRPVIWIRTQTSNCSCSGHCGCCCYAIGTDKQWLKASKNTV